VRPGTTGSRRSPRWHVLPEPRYATASRHNSDVLFDWHAPDTWPTALDGCDRVYLVPPPGIDVAPAMVPFVELARRSGVERLVLLSTSVTPMGSWAAGVVHQALAENGSDDFVVLRPSWFMQNVTGEHHLARMIRDEDPHRDRDRRGNESDSSTPTTSPPWPCTPARQDETRRPS